MTLLSIPSALGLEGDATAIVAVLGGEVPLASRSQKEETVTSKGVYAGGMTVQADIRRENEGQGVLVGEGLKGIWDRRASEGSLLDSGAREG